LAAIGRVLAEFTTGVLGWWYCTR